MALFWEEYKKMYTMVDTLTPQGDHTVQRIIISLCT